jgi:hypothetical protein
MAESRRPILFESEMANPSEAVADDRHRNQPTRVAGEDGRH